MHATASHTDLKDVSSYVPHVKSKKSPRELEKELDQLAISELQEEGGRKTLLDELKRVANTGNKEAAQKLEQLINDVLPEDGGLKELWQQGQKDRTKEAETGKRLAKLTSCLLPEDGSLKSLWDRLINLKYEMKLKAEHAPKNPQFWTELGKVRHLLKNLTEEEVRNLTSYILYQVDNILPEMDMLVVLPQQHRIIGSRQMYCKTEVLLTADTCKIEVPLKTFALKSEVPLTAGTFPN